MNESIGATGDEHHLTMPADVALLASLRQRVAKLLRDAGADDSVVADLKLAVSELATNVMQHSSASTVDVVLRHEPGRWVLDVDDAQAIDVLDATTPPDHDVLTGRGLFIVHAVMDEVEVVDEGGHRLLRCSKLVS
jgi:serine/threonine-protein kinase RsbW